MSQKPEITHDPLKPWKYILLPTTIKTAPDFFPPLLKAFFAICIVGSIFLVFSYTFSRNSGRLDYSERSWVRKDSSGYGVGDGDEGETNITHIMFGISGSAKTWNNRRHFSELWWKPNITRGFVWLDEDPAGKVPWPEKSPPYRVDIRGDPYGLLAAHPVAPLVSLHHLDYVQPLFPGLNRIDSLKKLVGAYNVDPGRALQRAFCYDLSRNWSVSVSWGYTVQLYPSLVTAKEMDTPFKTFVTWMNSDQEPFTFNTRVMSSDPCQKPVIYFLDRVQDLGRGQTLTSYQRRLAVPGKECGRKDYVPALSVRFINVTAATFSPNMWKKAPRRQCCEVVNGATIGVDGGLQIRIRGCNRWESVTPP
ncbi:hypothetical protein U1Q18_013408 [Sarracenia purpurea var. burkii]